MALISIYFEENIATVAMSNEIPNAINNDLIEALSTGMEQLEKDDTIEAVILTSANSKIFSLGFDLPHLLELDADGFAAFFDAFNALALQLYNFPKPLIAAIPGHAIAGGCILALCCDKRYFPSGKKLMGLNEVKLGLTVPWPAEVILRETVGNRLADNVLLEGILHDGIALFKMGLVDEICEPEFLKVRAEIKAKEMASNFNPAFTALKLNYRKEIIEKIKVDLDARNKEFQELWFLPKTQVLLREAAKTF